MGTTGNPHRLAAAVAVILASFCNAAPCRAQSQPPPLAAPAPSLDPQFQKSCDEMKAVATRCGIGVTWLPRDGACAPNTRRSLSPNIQATPLSQTELRFLLPIAL